MKEKETFPSSTKDLAIRWIFRFYVFINDFPHEVPHTNATKSFRFDFDLTDIFVFENRLPYINRLDNRKNNYVIAIWHTNIPLIVYSEIRTRRLRISLIRRVGGVSGWVCKWCIINIQPPRRKKEETSLIMIIIMTPKLELPPPPPKHLWKRPMPIAWLIKKNRYRCQVPLKIVDITFVIGNFAFRNFVRNFVI